MDIRAMLAEAAKDRASKWQPIYVSKLPDIMKLNEMALLGAYSFSLPETRRRIIRDTIEIVPGVHETPSAIARDYVRGVYEHGPKGTKSQLAKTAIIAPVPNVALPQKYAYGMYIDIKSCYWSIMLIAGWDVDYYPGMWLSPGRAPSDYPFPDHKIGRNCLVSVGQVTGIPRYMPRKLPGDPFDEIKPGNNLTNTQLPLLIHDVLNSIAAEAIRAGAIYANNDGFITPTPGIGVTVRRIIEDWGLSSSIKGEGSGNIKSSGAYRVGNLESLPYRMRDTEQALTALYPPTYAKWLKKQFSFFAR